MFVYILLSAILVRVTRWTGPLKQVRRVGRLESTDHRKWMSLLQGGAVLREGENEDMRTCSLLPSLLCRMLTVRGPDSIIRIRNT